MTSAGVGVAVHLDGFTAAGLAAHRALAAAGTRTAKVAIVFAGIKHDDDEYAGVLSAVQRTLPGAAVIGCSATGVLTGAEEVENANAVVVQVLDGDGPLPTPLFLPGVRGEPRGAGAKLGQRARDALDGDVDGAAVAVLVDPAELDAADFVAGIADGAPGLLITGAGASGGEAGCRVFWEDSAHADSAVALVLPRALHPSLGMTQGCQALGDPLTITAAPGSVRRTAESTPAYSSSSCLMPAKTIATAAEREPAAASARCAARPAAVNPSRWTATPTPAEVIAPSYRGPRKRQRRFCGSDVHRR